MDALDIPKEIFIHNILLCNHKVHYIFSLLSKDSYKMVQSVDREKFAIMICITTGIPVVTIKKIMEINLSKCINRDIFKCVIKFINLWYKKYYPLYHNRNDIIIEEYNSSNILLTVKAVFSNKIYIQFFNSMCRVYNYFHSDKYFNNNEYINIADYIINT